MEAGLARDEMDGGGLDGCGHLRADGEGEFLDRWARDEGVEGEAAIQADSDDGALGADAADLGKERVAGAVAGSAGVAEDDILAADADQDGACGLIGDGEEFGGSDGDAGEALF